MQHWSVAVYVREWNQKREIWLVCDRTHGCFPARGGRHSSILEGWTMCFHLMTPGLVTILNSHTVIACNIFLLIYSLKKINLISTAYSSFTSWCLHTETISAAVNCCLYKYCFLWSPCPFWLFSYPFRCGYPAATMTHWESILKSIQWIIYILY